MKITDELVERISRDKRFWHKIAAEIIAEAAQNVPRETDSAIAPPVASIGRILESRLLPRTQARFPLVPGKGPRSVPMIYEAATISPSGGPVSQRKALRLKRQWDLVRLRAQERAQRIERGDAAGEGEEEEEGNSPMQDHPDKSCSDAHAGMSHDDFLDKQEEEEEERQRPNVNPLFRNPRSSFDTSRRRQEVR